MRLILPKKSFFIFLIVLFTTIGYAQCSITTSRTTTGLTCGTSPLNSCGGVLYIGDGTNPMILTMTSNVDLSCLGPIRFIVKNGATIDFSSGNYDLILAAGSSIEIESGGQVGAPTNCSASDLIKIGDVKVASCMGGSALTNFPDLVSNGGYSSISVSASPSSICNSGTSTLTATASPSTGATLKWYDAQTGGSLLNTGSTYNIGPITSTKTYYVEAVYSGYTTVRKAVTVTVTNAAAPTGTASQSFCSGATVVNLLATGTDVKWYAASSGGTALASTTVLTNGTHYYASQTVSGCESSSRLDVTAIINSASVAPTSITGTTTICNGESTVLTVNGGNLGTGAAIEWFTGLCNGTLVGTGNSITVSPTTDTTYYVRYNGLCNTTTCVSTTVTVNSLPNNITNGFSATTICAGGSPQLTFDAEDATFSTPYSITYKNDATSVQYTVSIPSAAPYSFTPGDNPTSNTTYTLVSISNATCTRTNVPSFNDSGASLYVRPIPTATVSGTTSVCVGASSPNITFTNPQTVAITITYNINGGTNQTVNVAGGGNSSTNVAVSTASAGDFVYNLVSVVYQSTPNCSNTLSGSATVTVNSNSVAPTSITGTTTICSGGSTILTLSGGTAGTGAVAKWYSGSCGGTLVGTGSSINVSPTSTTTYFVRYEGTCNTTSCASATVTVNDNNTVSEASSSPILCANATMTNVTHTTTGATGIGVASNLPAGVTASWASNTIIITGVPTESGTFNYNIPLTGGCGNVSATGTIVVNPLPTTPIAGTPTNPTCTRPTGSVPLSGLPSSGTIIQTGYKSDSYTITGGGTQVISGLLPGTYYFAIDNGSCVSGTVTVVIIAPVTNTWSTGSWSDGTPTINQRLVFASDYTNANDVDIEGCSCQVTGSTTVTIKSGRTLKIENGVEVQSNAKLIFENNASLVQINEDPTINSGDIIYHRHTGFVKRYDFTYWSSPVAGQTLKALSPNTLYDKYYSYNPTSGWKIEYNGAAIMEKGRGYIIRAPQTFSITVPAVDTAPEFVGVPNNGLVSYAVLPNLVNLVGNPYPSAVDADKFIAANSASLEGTLYFWTHNTSPSKNIEGDAIYNYTANDYFVYNKTGGVGVSGKIAAGQSFFAPSSTTGGTVLFNNAMRYTEGQPNYDNSQFYKLGSTSKTTAKAKVEIKKSRIWLNLTNKEGAYKQMLIGYIDGATNNYDAGFDGVTYDGNQFVDFYSVNNAVNLAIQGRALPFVKQDSIALGYKSTIAGDFQISIDHADGILETQNVFLEDKTLNVIHDLRKEAYTFTTAKGVFNNRFILRYVDKNAVEEVAAPVVSEELSNEVVASVKDGVITVNSTVGALRTVVIYDVSGGILYQKDNVDSNELVIQQLISSHQVLVITIVLSDGTSLSRKVIY